MTKHWIATYGGHYRALIRLGLPIVVGQLGMIVLGFADTLMIGHHSTTELGAASFVNNLFNLCIIFSTGFSYGLTPIVGGLYGNKRLAEAGQHFQIVAECYAGHGPRMESGCFCRKGEKPFSDEDGPQLVTAPSCVAVWQEEIFQTAMDFLTLYSILSRRNF